VDWAGGDDVTLWFKSLEGCETILSILFTCLLATKRYPRKHVKRGNGNPILYPCTTDAAHWEDVDLNHTDGCRVRVRMAWSGERKTRGVTVCTTEWYTYSLTEPHVSQSRTLVYVGTLIKVRRGL
jgi:hypothetical protein